MRNPIPPDIADHGSRRIGKGKGRVPEREGIRAPRVVLPAAEGKRPAALANGDLYRLPIS
jgi:hypothetical protein